MKRIAGILKTWLVPLALFVATHAAEAQPMEGARTVRPGDALVDGTRIRPGAWEMRYLSVVDGREQEMGRMHHELTVLDQGGHPLLRSIQAFHGPNGTGADTVVAERASLTPRSHRSSHGASSLALDFEGRRVRGKAVSNGAAPKVDERTLDAPVFDANFLEIVLGSLPLEEGLHVGIPTYVHEQKEPMWFDARVAGVERVEIDGVAAPAWAVVLTMPKGTGTFWIDRDTRQLVKGEVTSPEGRQFRMVRTRSTSRP